MQKKWSEAQLAAKQKTIDKAVQAAKMATTAARKLKIELKNAQKQFASQKQTQLDNNGIPTKPKTQTQGELAKKRAVYKLDDTWADSFFEFAKNRIKGRNGAYLKGARDFCLAIAIAELSGLRPAELENGVKFTLHKTGAIAIHVSGAKVKEVNGERFRGIQQRTLFVNKECKAFFWLKENLHFSAIRNGFKFDQYGHYPAGNFKWKKGTFRQQCSRVLAEFKKTEVFKGWSYRQRKTFSDFYSPYIYRSLFAYELIDSETPASMISACMGHRATDSIQSYARTRGRKTQSPITKVTLGVSDQVICHLTKEILFDHTGMKAEGSRPAPPPTRALTPAPKKSMGMSM